jgi:hypothetical protein
MSRAMFYRLLKEGRKELRFRQRGDTHKERLAKLKAEREQVELENAITKGDFLNRQALEQAFVEIVAAMKQIVRASKLDRASQDDFLRTLSSIPIVIRDTARAAHQRNGPNGDGATLRKPRKKKKAAANKVTDG